MPNPYTVKLGYPYATYPDGDTVLELLVVAHGGQPHTSSGTDWETRDVQQEFPTLDTAVAFTREALAAVPGSFLITFRRYDTDAERKLAAELEMDPDEVGTYLWGPGFEMDASEDDPEAVQVHAAFDGVLDA